MASQPPASFGAVLGRAIKAAGRTQAWLAGELTTDPGQVSRWTNNRAVPHINTVKTIEKLLNASLLDAFAAAAPAYELFVSAPITGLGAAGIESHRDLVRPVVEAAEAHVNGVYWPGRDISSMDDLAAADLATEKNLAVFGQVQAFLYLQFTEIVRPSSALIELGLALGRRVKTTILIKRGLSIPYMLDGFQGVAANTTFLPQARIYFVDDVDDAARRISRNGRGLLGLD